jgi:hypothetical protein
MFVPDAFFCCKIDFGKSQCLASDVQLASRPMVKLSVKSGVADITQPPAQPGVTHRIKSPTRMLTQTMRNISKLHRSGPPNRRPGAAAPRRQAGPPPPAAARACQWRAGGGATGPPGSGPGPAQARHRIAGARTRGPECAGQANRSRDDGDDPSRIQLRVTVTGVQVSHGHGSTARTVALKPASGLGRSMEIETRSFQMQDKFFVLSQC